MTRLTQTAILLCVTCALVCGSAAPSWSASLFSGLVLSQSEQEGVKVIEVYPGSPAEKAGMRVGDVIIRLDGKNIRVLNDFVVKSRTIDKKVPEVAVGIVRRGEPMDIVIASYSMPVYRSWKVKVTEPPYTTLPGVSLFQYWMEKGKGKLQENKGHLPVKRELDNLKEALTFFFYALHYSPTSADAGLMVADTYRTMAEIYQKTGPLPDALQSYARAAEFYNKSSNKTTREEDLQRILSNLHDVEEKLFLLLPQEQSEAQPVTQGPDVTRDEQ